MNPIKLKLKNFRNYKTLDIPFDHKGVMPIVGENGHGKSTIFYGILLALYGKVVFENVEAQMKELFLNDGSIEMGVEFEFSQGGNLYRIERIYQYSKSKKGVEKVEQVKCELNQIIGDKFIPLSSKQKSITDDKIVDIIGKDCDNFRNSAFFPQGEENRLAKLKPSELIEEISKLKHITIWEDLRKKAKNKLDSVIIEIGGADSYIEESKKEIEQKSEIQEKINLLNDTITILRSDINNVESELSQISIDKNNLLSLISNIQQIEKDFQSVKIEVEEISNDLRYVDNDVFSKQSVISNKNEIENSFLQLKNAEENKQLQDNLLIHKNNLMQKISALETEVRNAENSAKQKYQELLTKREYITSILSNSITVRQRYDFCKQELYNFVNIQQQSISLEQTNQQIVVEATKLKSTNEHLMRLIDDEVSKVNRIIENGTCLECERSIDHQSLEAIKNHKSHKIDSYKIEGRNNEIRITELEQIFKNNQQSIYSLNEQLKQKPLLDREIGQLENSLSNIDNATKELDVLEPKIQQILQVIENGSYSDNFSHLNELKGQLDSVNYDSEQHKSFSQLCQQLKPYESKYIELSRYETELPLLLEKKQVLTVRYESKKSRLNEINESLSKLDKNALNQRFSEIQISENDKKQNLNVKKNEFNRFLQEFGAMQEAMERILGKENQLKDKIEQLSSLKRKKFLIERAMDMYSKTGIPTLIIENLLPDIESEANRLLELMGTDRAISFERATKADGSTQDKLVIMVRDRRGQKRAFYTYSGAECFQISFALRVAICGSDDVMFIDEGFGKLDSKFLQTVMRTLSALQKKFDKIILITHVQELIEQFDVKLNVSLDAKGYSTAKWVES